jgi:hypothetical protein
VFWALNGIRRTAACVNFRIVSHHFNSAYTRSESALLASSRVSVRYRRGPSSKRQPSCAQNSENSRERTQRTQKETKRGFGPGSSRRFLCALRSFLTNIFQRLRGEVCCGYSDLVGVLTFLIQEHKCRNFQPAQADILSNRGVLQPGRVYTIHTMNCLLSLENANHG